MPEALYLGSDTELVLNSMWLNGKESTCQRRRIGFNPWVEKILWRRKWQPTHFSILAWKIPWTEEPGGLQSMGVSESQT